MFLCEYIIFRKIDGCREEEEEFMRVVHRINLVLWMVIYIGAFRSQIANKLTQDGEEKRKATGDGNVVSTTLNLGT